MIYTSGSTGQPKGVELPHRALTNFLWTMRERPGLGPEDVLVAVTTLSFDIAGLELYLPLCVGGRVVVAPGRTAADPTLLAELLERSGATVMQATPTTWRMLLDAGWRGRPGFKALCGGEALPVALAEELLACGLELWNMYGPTETTIWSTVAPLAPDEPLTIGRPIGNTSLYVLDQRLQPLPIGVAGELFIGGDGLARGYRNRPELTAERFVDNPFGHGRLYRTGDLARYRPDGSVEYLGRLDHQVKVRGFRIELGEIESALEKHPEVARAVAIVREDQPGDKRLVAFVVPHDASEPRSADLRAFLAQTLPEYMIPAAYHVTDSIPLTSNGKVDRLALQEVELGEAGVASEFEPPRTDDERTIAAVWSDVLSIAKVGVNDDFFVLGGHSLLAMRVVSQLQKKFGVDLGLRTLFDSPTVAGLAAALQTAETPVDRGVPGLVRIDRVRYRVK